MSYRTFKFEVDGCIKHLNEADFTQKTHVRPLFQLEPDNSKYLSWVERKCKKALKKGKITEEQIWLGAYYSREITSGHMPDVTIRWIDNIKGYGLFTNKALRKKQFVGEYTGVLRKRKKKLDQTNSYCFEYLIGEGIDTPFTIDAKESGNHVRFINHSFEGNLDPMLVYLEGKMHVILYANQLIAKGAELTYDYGEDYWAKREPPI